MKTFKEKVEAKIKELSGSDKLLVNGYVPEDEEVHHIMIVDGHDVRAREYEDHIEWEADDVCEYCGGTGEVNTMAPVWPNEPHEAPIGTEKCICQNEDINN